MNFFPIADEKPDRDTLNRLANVYDMAGPRYTSYPTAPHFSEDFNVADYRSRLVADRASNIAPLSIYLHIPFCSDVCYYCACNKIVTRDPKAARQYLDALRSEIALQGELFGKRRPVVQLHLGGGTPTFLTHAELTELMHVLACHFRLVDSSTREYSIEIDPRTITNNTLALLKGLGFNRLSFGIQDFDPDVQAAIHREQSHASVSALVAAARDYAFHSISFDLIYGLPRQTLDSMRQTLDKVIALAPDRIACYSYAHLPERFPSQRAIDRLSLPSAQHKLAMQAMISETLTEHGYLHIGLDHYVRPHDELAIAQRHGKLQRNFQGYSTAMAPDLVGIGVSAIGATPNCYVQNEKELSNYYRRLAANELPIQRGLLLSADDEIRRHTIMALICNLRVDTADFALRFNVDFSAYFSAEVKRLPPLEEDGLVSWQQQGRILVVTAAGRIFLRSICMVFDRYLSDKSTIKHSKII